MAERTRETHELSRYADVVAALADPALAPVPPEESAQATPEVFGTAAWLRTHVARFAHGPEHARRRAVIETELARLDPAALRKAAALTPAESPSATADPRAHAVYVLAQALGLPDPDRVVADVALVSEVYFGGDSAPADAAVARLVSAYSTGTHSTDAHPTDGTSGPDSSSGEEIANRISVLIQAYQATGSLVELAAAHVDPAAHAVPTPHADSTADTAVAADVTAILTETLRQDPPVRAMRRVAVRDTSVAGLDIAAGDFVTLDIAAANRDPEHFPRPDEFDPARTASPPALTFGSAPRRCPGHAQALALAAGILESATTGQDG
jgi:cytochrome P450